MENRRQTSFDFSGESPGMLTPTYWTPGKPEGITTVHPMKAQKANLMQAQAKAVEEEVDKHNNQPEELERPVYGQYLELPKPSRFFLISPPSSPPVGWQPIEEDGPVINYELIAALAQLGGEEEPEVELYPGSEGAPKLVVKCI